MVTPGTGVNHHVPRPTCHAPGSAWKLYEFCWYAVGILYLLSCGFMCYNRVATGAIIIQALTGQLDQSISRSANEFAA